MSKRTLFIVGTVAAVLSIVVVCSYSPAKKKPETGLIDYLHKTNADLTAQNKILADASAKLSQARDKALHERDSLKVVSDSATRSNRRDRAALPLPSAVPDSMLRFMYAQATALVDRLIEDNDRLHLIITDDSLGMAKQFAIDTLRDQRLANMELQYQHEQVVSANWKKQFDDLNAERHPRCGRKCGIVLGVLSTIGAAIGIHQVQETLK